MTSSPNAPMTDGDHAILLEAGSAAGLRLVVRFERDRDWYRQHVLVDDADGLTGFLFADGPGQADPPLQHLVREDRDGSPVVLGLGSAGRLHWSVSMKSLRGRPAIHVEVACRTHPLDVRPLGSSWRVPDSARCDPDQRGGLKVTTGDRHLHLVADGSATATFDPQCREIRIVPATDHSAEHQTIVWSWMMTAVSASHRVP